MSISSYFLNVATRKCKLKHGSGSLGHDPKPEPRCRPRSNVSTASIFPLMLKPNYADTQIVPTHMEAKKVLLGVQFLGTGNMVPSFSKRVQLCVCVCLWRKKLEVRAQPQHLKPSVMQMAEVELEPRSVCLQSLAFSPRHLPGLWYSTD